MTTLEDQVVTLHAELDAILAAVSALSIPPTATVDLSPVLQGIADIKAQFAPTPVEAPAAPAADAPVATEAAPVADATATTDTTITTGTDGTPA